MAYIYAIVAALCGSNFVIDIRAGRNFWAMAMSVCVAGNLVNLARELVGHED